MLDIVQLACGRLTGGVTTAEDLAHDLARAIRDRELFAVYQPQVAMPSGLPVAVEVLSRWQHPERGNIAPDTFIAVAEESGSIFELGKLMLDAALDAAQSWSSEGRSIEVSVNVSPLQIADDEFAEHLLSEVRRRALPEHSLIIEITETLPLIATHPVVERLREIRAHGIGVSLDDFGTGHALLEQLESLPLTEVKLDGSLVRDAGRHSDGELRDVIELAHDRDVRVVAEGVETQEHLERVAALQCDRAQGYFICRPRPKSDIDELLAR